MKKSLSPFLKINRFSAILMTAFLCLSSLTFAQTGTFNRVYTLIQNNCASCHSGVAPSGGLNLGGTASQVHTNLVNVTPQNSAAAAKGQKLIMPGHPYKSFLLRKIGNGYVHDLDGGNLDLEEGAPMPFYSIPLQNQDIEIIRQWIYAGAPINGTIASENLVDQYFMEGGFEPIDRPAPPPPDKGFQIHLGPIFVASLDEKEYLLKYNPQLSSAIEIKRMEAFMNQSSHHFILYKFNSTSAANGVSNGLREVSLFGENPLLGSGTNLVSVWQYSDDFRLPAGTAYFWNQNTILDLNYHIPNYSAGLVLPSDVYINVYTQPTGTAIKEMQSDLLIFQNPIFFTIPPGTHVLQEPVYNPQQWNIWMLSSHTHKYGVDFDIYRQLSGGPGEQLFEGYYDYQNCGCDLGFYDWSHPPVRYFEPMYNLPSGVGLYHRATYNNTGSSAVSVGLTTDNEMMISIIQYTTGSPIPYVDVSASSSVYCVDAPEVALEFAPADGVLEGPGITGNVFVPAVAGIGTHTITYTYDDITAEFDITVTEPLGTETIVQNDNVLSIPSDYQTYQWYMNGIPVDGANSNTFTPLVSGSYSVTYTLNSCTATSETTQFVISGITPSEQTGFNFEVYPNPSNFNNTYLTYHLHSEATVSIELYDLSSRKIETVLSPVLQSSGTYQTPLSSLKNIPNGVYFIRVNINSNSITKKIVKL
ncbi:MAG: T9SS type A sorting domain-containing protein [Sphingobacteriales bacterium]|nr:MAG: T9SS type A sorting domain-containing protein [Sphingobacteriales bacterium]